METADLHAAIRVAEAYIQSIPSDASRVVRQASADVETQVAAARDALEALEEAKPTTWGRWLWSLLLARDLEAHEARVVRCSVVLEKRMTRLLEVVRAPPEYITNARPTVL